MANSPAAETARRQRIALGALGVLAVVMGVIVFFSLRSPPQMGASREVFATVDALYTAVRNKDVKQLAGCEQRLRGYRESGTLPKPAALALDTIISTARSGKWPSAARSLYEFMKAQRRDGALAGT